MPSCRSRRGLGGEECRGCGSCRHPGDVPATLGFSVHRVACPLRPGFPGARFLCCFRPAAGGCCSPRLPSVSCCPPLGILPDRLSGGCTPAEIDSFVAGLWLLGAVPERALSLFTVGGVPGPRVSCPLAAPFGSPSGHERSARCPGAVGQVPGAVRFARSGPSVAVGAVAVVVGFGVHP